MAAAAAGAGATRGVPVASAGATGGAPIAGARATGGVPAAGAGATGGALAEVVLGPPEAGVPGVELTAGGGEFQSTRGRKE